MYELWCRDCVVVYTSPGPLSCTEERLQRSPVRSLLRLSQGTTHACDPLVGGRSQKADICLRGDELDPLADRLYLAFYVTIPTTAGTPSTAAISSTCCKPSTVSIMHTTRQASLSCATLCDSGTER